MNDQIKEELKEIFLNVLQGIKAEDFSFEKNRIDFEGWDSLAHMQIISDIESHFGVSFDIDEVVGINKPEDLIALINKKKNG